MSKVLIGVLALLFVIAMIPVTVIALSAPSSPPAMASMAGPLSRVNFEDVPTPQRFQARDGARLQYYAYPAAQNKVVVLVHGSVGPGKGMHAPAKALRDAGVSTYVLDIRGHGGSGRRGDIDYIGQIDDDLDDFVTSLGPMQGPIKSALLSAFPPVPASRSASPAAATASCLTATCSSRRSCREHPPCVQTLVVGQTFQFRVSSPSLRSIA